MDYLTNKEFEKLQRDVISKNAAIEAEKYTFEQQLKNGLGEEIIKQLNSPPKSNWWEGLKIKYRRWKAKREDFKNYKQIIKNL